MNKHTATIELYRITNDKLLKCNRKGTLLTMAWVVTIGTNKRICPSERSAHAYLKKEGYEYTRDNEWVKTLRSDDEMYLANNYLKINHQ